MGRMAMNLALLAVAAVVAIAASNAPAQAQAASACKRANIACRDAVKLCDAAGSKGAAGWDAAANATCRDAHTRCQALNEACPAPGCWIDAQTGKPTEAPGRPFVDPVDGNHAYDPMTGQNFVKAPCPEPGQNELPGPRTGAAPPAVPAIPFGFGFGLGIGGDRDRRCFGVGCGGDSRR